MRAIANTIRKAQIPEYLSLNQIRNNPLINMSNIVSYITSNRNHKYNVGDLIRSGNIPFGLQDPSNKGAGSWTSGVSANVSKIKNKANKWSIKSPKIIGKYATNAAFKVKDFLTGMPKISFDVFRGMMEDVFGQANYDFYFNSDKYGDWFTAFQAGYMNCNDSTEALIAMAHAMGLPASKVHGHWGNVGHFWANVAGHKMDTTGWMTQRTWTPSKSHAGPSPSGFGFKEFIQIIKDLFDDDSDKPTPTGNGSNDISVSGEVTIVHEFINLPEGVTAEELARLINDVPESENWIKKLVKNTVFQKWDLKEKARIEAKNNRARGV